MENDFRICILEEKHLPLVGAFSCIETDDELKKLKLKSKVRRRIKKHSGEMEMFLKEEAFEEQEKGLNRTHLLVHRTKTGEENIVAYISLCNDSVKLERNEQDEMDYAYPSIPALKIARLAVDNRYKRSGIGKLMIEFAALQAVKIKKISGLAFINLDCYEHRRSYYEAMGFVENEFQPVRLDYDSPISMRVVLIDFLEKITE